MMIAIHSPPENDHLASISMDEAGRDVLLRKISSSNMVEIEPRDPFVKYSSIRGHERGVAPKVQWRQLEALVIVRQVMFSGMFSRVFENRLQIHFGSQGCHEFVSLLGSLKTNSVEHLFGPSWGGADLSDLALDGNSELMPTLGCLDLVLISH